MSRRGQRSGSPAAALVGIITLLLIFYILFLPPAEREALLEDQRLAPGEVLEEVLLDVPVGRLAFTPRDRFDHPLPNIYLIESRNAQVLGQENPFIVRKGWFGEQKKTFVFSLADLENTANVILSFQAPLRRGLLHISLNGVPIFESQVALQNPPPVSLAKALLSDRNVLEFSATGGFFSTRKYSLTDVKVIGDITDVEKQKSINTFSISDVELDNFEAAFLDFYPICDQRAVGKLTVEINGRIISSSVPACESLNRQELFSEDLNSGKNTLIFRISQGRFRIEQVRVRTHVKPVKAFVDYFEITPSLYNAVLDKRVFIILDIEFVDDGRTKQARTNINGRLDVLDQRTPKFTRDISSVVREGNNYIEIQPLTELDIVKLQVRTE